MAYIFCFHGNTWLYSGSDFVLPCHIFFAFMGGHGSIPALTLSSHVTYFLPSWADMALFWL